MRTKRYDLLVTGIQKFAYKDDKKINLEKKMQCKFLICILIER